jgi:hypothetical protein
MGPTDNCGVPQVFEKQHFAASRLNISTNSGAWLHCSVNSGAMLHCNIVHVLTCTVFFFFFLNFEKKCKLIHSHCSHEIFLKKKTSVINWFHSHYSREREQYFFLFVKKNSLRWIKFTRIVISILFLIIFYLILLHAQKIMKTIVLVEWILYVMKL